MLFKTPKRKYKHLIFIYMKKVKKEWIYPKKQPIATFIQ